MKNSSRITPKLLPVDQADQLPSSEGHGDGLRRQIFAGVIQHAPVMAGEGLVVPRSTEAAIVAVKPAPCQRISRPNITNKLVLPSAP